MLCFAILYYIMLNYIILYYIILYYIILYYIILYYILYNIYIRLRAPRDATSCKPATRDPEAAGRVPFRAP